MRKLLSLCALARPGFRVERVVALVSLAVVSLGCRAGGALDGVRSAPATVVAPGGASGGERESALGAPTVDRASASRRSGASRSGEPRADASRWSSEPFLVTSGPASYWNAGELRPGDADGDVSVIVDPGRRLQTWLGLGGTFNEAGWDALMVLGEEDRHRALTLLFDVRDGIAFTWGRIPIGASDYALSRYTHDDRRGPGSRFDVRRDEQRLIPYVRAAQAVKADIRFWGSPWTPPPWMKTNGEHDRGAFDPRHMGAMARYLVKWIEAYESRGIPIDHVQPQNEPGWSQAYPSCAWGPSTADGVTTDRPVTLGTFVEQHLAPAIEAASLKTKIWYGTLSNGGTFDAYWSALSPAGRRLIGGVGLQWGTLGQVQRLASEGFVVMQTEHRCGNYPWVRQRATSPADANRENFLPDRAPNNHAYAEETWDMLKAWIEAGVSAYNAWNMVLDIEGFNLDVIRPWPQNALLTVDRRKKTLQVTPAYYVFRHLGQYVEAGAVRLGVEGGDALAFENPDGSIVTIVFNEDDAPRATTLGVGTARLGLDVPAHGWATVRWPG